MIALAFSLYTVARWAAARPLFAIRALTVVGADGQALTHISGQQVGQACVPLLRGTFFTADLEQARGVFEALPWVRRASIRREWPNRLVVALEEHRALARWNDEGGNRFVNLQGEAFNAPGEARLGATLPLLSGPEGSEKDVARRYADVLTLFAKIDKTPRVVALSPRQAWTVRLTDGLAIEVGREQAASPIAARLARFVANYGNTVGRMGSRVEAVDLRYPNGFAAKVSGGRPQAASPAAGKQDKQNKQVQPAKKAKPAGSST
ncbi:MAG TPA: cell division protein FtsQ/DivIB [Burkholderiales bacterium]|nr:cell division protein FtsQ/DivIB [Burkholderiales bacterium]